MVRDDIELQQSEFEIRKEELEDLRHARITRAWDLLHKAREQAAKRMDAAEKQAKDSGNCTLLKALNALQACQAAVTNDTHGSACQAEQRTLVDQRWGLRRPARGGNDGQIGAIHTLANAGVVLNGLVVNELYLQKLQLPGEQSLVGSSFRFSDLTSADLRDANLSNADLRAADLKRADLRDATFCKHPTELGAQWPETDPPKNLDSIVIDATSDTCQ